jgi:hypothetical protein
MLSCMHASMSGTDHDYVFELSELPVGGWPRS